MKFFSLTMVNSKLQSSIAHQPQFGTSLTDLDEMLSILHKIEFRGHVICLSGYMQVSAFSLGFMDPLSFVKLSGYKCVDL